MQISKFEVRDYKSCARTTITPSEGLTVLVGANGAGKSNILGAILLLSRLGEARPYRRQEAGQHVNITHLHVDLRGPKGTPAVLSGKVFYETNEQNAEEVLDFNFTYSAPLEGQKWREYPFPLIVPEFLSNRQSQTLQRRSQQWEIQRARQLTFWSPQHMRVSLRRSDQPALAMLQETTKYLTEIRYHSASQFADPSRCPVSVSMENGELARASYAERGPHRTFIYDLYLAWKAQSPSYKRFASTIGRDCLGLIDKVNFRTLNTSTRNVNVRVGGRAETRETVRSIVVPTFTVGGRHLSPNQLSEGTFRTIALIFYLLQGDKGLLLLEEPEACVHHGLLRSIMDIVKQESRQRQIIISSHSDHVLEQLEPEQVILIEKKAMKGTIAKSVSKTLGRADFAALKSYLGSIGNLGDYSRERGFSDD